jgi:intein/homing endonuclease
MRIKLSDADRVRLFDALKIKIGGADAIAKHLNISSRTVRDWRRGKFLMLSEQFDTLVDLAQIPKNSLSPEILPDFWHISEAGRKGGIARMMLYGDLGTPEGRSKGGRASIATHRRNGTKFSTLKDIQIPEQSEKLAEFLGIAVGDGHSSDYQLGVTTNSETDIQHAMFIAQMVHDLFGLESAFQFRKGEKAVDIMTSSRALVEFMEAIGMPRGNKIEHRVAIPKWVLENEVYLKAFLRGLFDTDGCVYLDRHIIKGATYRNLGWTITSRADTLKADVFRSLQELDYSPTCKAPGYSVFLRRHHEIVRYFTEIGTSNDKHRRRFESFIDQKRS